MFFYKKYANELNCVKGGKGKGDLKKKMTRQTTTKQKYRYEITKNCKKKDKNEEIEKDKNYFKKDSSICNIIYNQ